MLLWFRRLGYLYALLIGLSLAASIANAYDASDCEKGDVNTRISVCTKILNDSVSSNANRVSAYNNRGIAYIDKGEFDRAIADFNEALRINPKDALVYANRGNAYYRKGEFDRAIADYNEALRINPKFALAYNNRGIAYSDKGEFDRAIADYNEALRLDPKHADALYNLGSIFAAKGETETAVEKYNIAIERDNNCRSCLRGRGILYLATDQAERGLTDLKRAFELNVKDAYSVLWLDIAERRNNAERGLEVRAAHLNPNVWPAPIVRMFQGRATYAEVIATDASTAKARVEQQCEADFYAAELRLFDGDKPEALRLLNRAVASCPKTFIEYGAAVMEVSRVTALIAADEQAKAFDGFKYLTILGNGDIGDTREMVDNAIRKDPSDASLYILRSLLNAATFEPAKALKDLDTAKRLGLTDRNEVQLIRGLIHFYSGTPELGQKEMADYVASDPKDFLGLVLLDLVERRNGLSSRLEERTKNLDIGESRRIIVKSLTGFASLNDLRQKLNGSEQEVNYKSIQCIIDLLEIELALINNDKGKAVPMLRKHLTDCPKPREGGFLAVYELKLLGLNP